ncbi:hypothetical protein AAG906_012396 [Vitis piasezkii]
MSSSIKLDKDEKGKSIYFTMYKDMIGLTPPYLTPWRIISGTSKSLLIERPTYAIGEPIISTVREVEICLDPKSTCHVFYIAPIGLRDLRTCKCPMDGQNIGPQLDCDEQSTIPHDMLYPATTGGHRDKVSYYEAFLMDFILMGKLIHLGYLMMMHMISYCESMTRVLFYGRFLIRVFKDVELSFTEPPHVEIPPHQAPHAPNHAPWMDMTAQINSLGTCMEEFAIVSDSRFYFMEDRMDQYQVGFTSRFEHLEDCMDEH